MGAIGLNPIRLDRIGLDPIRINAIRLGVPGAASGFDRPYIDPEVLASLKAVCICYGKSNDDPDRAIVKNLVDPDNPFIISNAAYKLNSGYGKYETELSDTRIWTQSRDVTSSPFSSSYNGLSGWIIFANTELTNSADMPSFKIQVKGLLEGQELIYRYYDSAGQSNVYSMAKDGEYTLPADVRTAKPLTSNTSGFQIVKNETNTITITQIPSYQGAFVTDGVDDLITSTKTVQEMLEGSNEITVVSMIHQIKESIYNNRAYTNYINGNNGHFRNQVADTKTGIYGYTITGLNSTNASGSIVNNILGDKNDYEYDANTSVELGNAKYSVQNYIKSDGTASNIGSQVAWYWTIIANKVLTTDQINQVIAYYNLDRCVEPTVLYDVKRQGLSNDTPDSDWYLKDYSGNGYDMTLYNYAKTPESGINEGGGLQSDGVEDYGKVTGLPIYKDYTVVANRELFNAIGCVLSNDNPGAFIFETSSASAYSFGEPTTSLKIPTDKQIRYQTKYSYNGQNISIGAVKEGTSNMWLGTIRDNDARFRSAAIYSLMTFPYSMSEFLIERQLKKHKLGTLYPDMVEFRPIVKSNLPYSSISYSVNPGEYISVDSMVTITVTLPNTSDKLMEVSCNAISDISISGDNGVYEITGKVVKSPQKINLVISSYLTMLSNSTLISNETLIKNE